MQTVTIRLYPDTIEHLDKAARKAGVRRGTLIRHCLEQTFDGTPHNPLGVSASPAFYTAISEAVAVLQVQKLKFGKAEKALVEKLTDKNRSELEIDYEH